MWQLRGLRPHLQKHHDEQPHKRARRWRNTTYQSLASGTISKTPGKILVPQSICRCDEKRVASL